MFVVVSVVCTVGVVVVFCVVMMKKRERRVEEWRWKRKKEKRTRWKVENVREWTGRVESFTYKGKHVQREERRWM